MKAVTLLFIAGAPGSGKSTVAKKLARRSSGFVFFDSDWLIEAASGLAGRDIHVAPETWPPYSKLWLAILHAIDANGLTPILLTPSDPSDFDSEPLPDWCKGIRWLLLDCDIGVRAERLLSRGWDTVQVQEALKDAALMRRLIPQQIDTTLLSPESVADHILNWLELDQQKG